jgi:hypothetical protein
MDDNRDHPLDLPNSDPPNPQSPHRRFVYRAVEPNPNLSHPLRRATDIPRPFQGIPAQLCPNPLLLKFRVYLKLN